MGSGTRAPSPELGGSSQCRGTFFMSPLMLRIITMLFFLLSKIYVISAQHSSPSKFFRCCQSVQRLDTGYEPLGKCVKDMKRLKEEVNVAFKAGRLNEADRSPGPKYGM